MGVSCDNAPPPLLLSGLRNGTCNATIEPLQHPVQALLLMEPAYSIPPADIHTHGWANPDPIAVDFLALSASDRFPIVVFKDDRILPELESWRPT